MRLPNFEFASRITIRWITRILGEQAMRAIPAWRWLGLLAIMTGMPNLAWSATPTLVKRTYDYKTAGDTRIQADVYRADDTQARPVLVWLHGGALIMGNRSGVPKNLLDLCRTEGYILVSFDYRLAPEV